MLQHEGFYAAAEFHQCCSSSYQLRDYSGSALVLTHSNLGNSLKNCDTTEPPNSSMSNGTSDATLFDSPDDRGGDGEAGLVEKQKECQYVPPVTG